jgi:hypothetical protein
VDFPVLLRWCAEGEVPLDDIVARTIPFNELPVEFLEVTDGVRTVVRFDI